MRITTRIIRKVSLDEFRGLLNKYENRIVLNPHVWDHMDLGIRNVFKEEDIIKPLLNENPRGIGLQENGRYAVFYKRKFGFLKIILREKGIELQIVTFMESGSMPNLDRLENGN